MKAEGGSSLIEVMVTIFLSSLLAAMAVAVIQSGARAQQQHERTGSSQQAVATALDLMTREIATVGCTLRLAGHRGLLLATENRLQLASDRNADGDTEDANERITYALNNDRGWLTRASGAGSPQTLLRGVAAGGLHFRYFDTSGEVVPPGSDEAALRRITSIRTEITLVVQEAPAPTFQRLATLRNNGEP